MSAVTQNEYTGNGSTTNYSFTFPYLKASDIKASLDAVDTTAFTLANATTLQFNTAPNNGAKIKIFRETGVDNLTATFYAGSAIKSEDLNDNFTQNLFVTQEVNQRYLSTLGGTMTGNLNLGQNADITYEGSTANDNAKTTFTVVDPTADRTITFPNVTGTVVTTGDTGTVTGTMLANGTVTSTDIEDGTIVNVDINASAAIDGTKITPNFGNQNIIGGGYLRVNGNDDKDYTQLGAGDMHLSGGIDGAAVITVTESANNVSKLIIDGKGNGTGGAINGAGKIAEFIMTNATPSVDVIGNLNVFTNLDVDGATTLDGTTIDGALDVNGSCTIDNILIDGNTIDTTGGNILVNKDVIPNTDNSVDLGSATKEFKDLYIDGTGYIDTVSADDITGNAVVTSGTSTSDTKVYSAKRAGEIFYEKGTLDDITSGDSWVSDDNKLATTAAIDARITDLVDDVGGFVPIANETSFPNANPDVNNGTGTLVSVPLANNLTSNGSGVITIANGTVGNSTVTITGATASSTFAQGFGIIVETTSTLNTYTFHRYVPKATEITTVATNITNVNTTATNIGNVNSVGGNITNVNAVAGNATNINSAVSNASNINTVAGSISNVNNVGSNISNVNAVSNNESNINIVAGNNSNISTVAGISGNVTTIAGISGNVTTAANNATVINTVAGSITNVNNVGGAIGNVASVAASLSNVNTVASDIANVNTVAGNNLNINTVAGNNTNITTVANNNSNITAVAQDATDIGNVAGSIANVNTTAANIANVNLVGTNISNVNTVATNLTPINTAATYLNDFQALYLGAASSAPVTDGVGNPVNEGDLYFNSGNKQLQVYNGNVFTSIFDTALDFAKLATAAFNALYTASAGSNSIDLGGLAITGAAFSNEAVATNRVSLTKGSGTFNLGGI